MTETMPQTPTDKVESLKNIVFIVYLLQALSFIFGITFLIAVIINYIKREDAAGTWLESHFTWQIRTFWYGILWAVIGAITYVFVIGLFILGIAAIWIIYRIIKGWLYLNDKKEMYQTK